MSELFGFIADFAWKGTAVFAMAAMTAFILRRAPASARHIVWAAALVVSLAFPFLSRVVPQWTVPVWKDAPVASATDFRLDATASAADLRQTGSAAKVAVAGPLFEAARRTIDWRPLAVALWLFGAGIMLSRIAAGRIALRLYRRRATLAQPPIRGLARGLASDMGFRRRVEVLETNSATIPVTWGVLRPVILLPESSILDEATLRVTLTHELAHIARHDHLWQVLGDLTCALYWFHPLAWLARREALHLRERACDDVVLCAGVRPSDYAAEIVRLARTLSCPRLCGVPAISRCTQLESRVRAILDPRMRRTALRRSTGLAAAALAVLAALAIAPVRPATAGVAAPGAEQSDYEALDARAAESIRSFDFQGAVQLYNEALRARGRSGQNSVEYATGLVNLARTYRAWGHLGDAATYAAQALPLLERKLGATDAALFEPLYILGLQEQVSGGGPAQAYYERALAVARSSAVPGSAVSRVWNALAMMKAKTGDAIGALDYLDQGLSALSGDGSPAKLLLLRNRADALRKLGRTAEAAADEAQERELADSFSRAAKLTTAELPDGVSRIGDGVSPPARREWRDPSYSAEARVQHLEGTVVLSIVIGKDGSVRNIHIVRPIGCGLDSEAMEAVRRWKFEPGKKAGEPVAVQATVEVNFRLL